MTNARPTYSWSEIQHDIQGKGILVLSMSTPQSTIFRIKQVLCGMRVMTNEGSTCTCQFDNCSCVHTLSQEKCKERKLQCMEDRIWECSTKEFAISIYPSLGTHYTSSQETHVFRLLFGATLSYPILRASKLTPFTS